MIDRDTWHAVYADGTMLSEDEAGAWANVPMPIQAIVISSVGNAFQQTWTVIPEGATPILFRRRTKTIDPDREDDGPVVASVTVTGWHQGDASVYVWHYEDGSIRVTAKDDG